MYYNVAIIGSNGLVGSEVLKVFPGAKALLHSDISIENFEGARKVLTAIRPDFIVNTAGLNNTDLCEQKPTRAFTFNVLGVKNLALIAEELNVPLAHFSTDYVFGGDNDRRKPYTEKDLPHPVNVCGISKLAGEHFITSYCQKHYVIRTAALYGPAGSRAKGGRDFVKTMLTLSKERDVINVVSNQFVSPTCAIDLAKKLKELIETGQYGTYHIAGSGVCSWYEFAEAVFAFTGIRVNVNSVQSDPTVSLRRAFYTGLRNERLLNAGLKDLDNWKICLERYLQTYGPNP